jgi:DNA-binding NarL/FixJ family response regulator
VPDSTRMSGPTVDGLTLEILSAMAQGMSTTEAAVACNVSLSTLRRRLDDARRAWRLEHNTELIVHAVREGMI